MKKIIKALAIVLATSAIAACSKDDEPKNSGKFGYFEIEGNTVNLKYGYDLSEDGNREYYFSDLDMTKESNYSKKMNVLILSFQDDNSVQVGFEYEVDHEAETGYEYDFETPASSGLVQAEFGSDNYVDISGKCPNMVKYDYDTGKRFGQYDGSFAVSGKVKSIDTRSSEIQKVTDANLIARIKAHVKME